jgi:hypothetical protein
MVGCFDGWFLDWDEGSKGSLDEEAMGRGLNRVIGPPPGR